jgi:hypothetical protein
VLERVQQVFGVVARERLFVIIIWFSSFGLVKKNLKTKNTKNIIISKELL